MRAARRTRARSKCSAIRSSPASRNSTAPVTKPSARRTDARALTALFLGATGIAFAPIFVRLSELDPTATAFNRFAIAVPVLWLWFALENRARKPDTSAEARPRGARDYAMLALAGLLFAGDIGFWHWSIAYTSIANATLLANTAPVFVVLGGWLIFGRRVRPLFLAGMALAMAGTAILMQTSASLGARPLLGDLLGVITGFFYGAYLLVIERLRARFSTATIMAHAIPVSALAMLAASLANGEQLVAASAAGWAVLIALALVSQVFGQSMIAFGLAHLPVAFASVSLLVQPVMATVFAWVLLAEAVGPIQAAGAVVVLSGIWVARRGSAR